MLRVGGAQIPVTMDIEKNVQTIKTAIDWANANSVNYLVTPECALSGYVQDINDTPMETKLEYQQGSKQRYYVADKPQLESALVEIEQYSADKDVGLCLGTIWKESGMIGEIKRNQIRFYHKGVLQGTTNKTYIITQDHVLPHDLHRDGLSLTSLFDQDNNPFNVFGLICNDMWGGVWHGGMHPFNLAQKHNMVASPEYKIKLAVHSTNGERGNGLDEIVDVWHNANLRWWAKSIGVPIITVDNAIHLNGKDYDGPTSSESGVIDAQGNWVTKVPRIGTQYFYYDFD